MIDVISKKDYGSSHTPPRGKAKGAGGLDSKRMEAFNRICNKVHVGMVPVNVKTKTEKIIKVKSESILTRVLRKACYALKSPSL